MPTVASMMTAEVNSEMTVLITDLTTQVRRRVIGTVRRRVCQGPSSLSV
jgi:hypothetical protein